MAAWPWRLLGLALLTLAITIPSCQSVFARVAVEAPRPVAPAVVPD